MAIHHFQPDRYYHAIGSHEPVLRIKDGDTVVTSTLDSRGFDGRDQQVAERGNPQTGPFYIEGASPGDTLAVTFDAIVPNRPRGYSRCMVAPNVVDPDYVPELPEPILSRWRVDPGAGVATIVEPKLCFGEYTLPLRPMLGCFGVAPDRGQAISTATSGPHGGNMDFNGFTAGTTAYLPVFVEGALFHLGDGHALQGDGEILGTGIEISMDVRFTVRVIKGGNCRWPRGENESEIFTLGNARPLDQALQHATTEMLRWLRDEYKLEPHSAHLLLGHNVRYSVGNVYNPAYTAVCRIAKSVLRASLPSR